MEHRGLSPADANPDKLQRVLLNLLQNAIHHTPPDGSVAVRAAAVNGTVEVEVADTGAGIAAEDRPHVFEPFYRGGGDVARTRPGGGLGLAISRAIVEAHGGRIWLAEGPSNGMPEAVAGTPEAAGGTPEAAGGTRIRFTLPLTDSRVGRSSAWAGR